MDVDVYMLNSKCSLIMGLNAEMSLEPSLTEFACLHSDALCVLQAHQVPTIWSQTLERFRLAHAQLQEQPSICCQPD